MSIGEVFPSGNPFGTPTLIFLDAIRLTLIVCSIGIAAFALPIARHVRNSRQFGCYALSAYAIFAAIFQFARVGQPTVSPALLLIVLGSGLGVAYVYRVAGEIRRGKYRNRSDC